MSSVGAAWLVAALWLFAQSPQLVAQTAEAEPARQAADSWLVSADARDGDASWEAAGTFFRMVISRERWHIGLGSVREPLGAVMRRVVRRTVPTPVPPGAPDGVYLVTEYDSRFERNQSVFEAVTVVREPDGVWRVAGYFIR